MEVSRPWGSWRVIEQGPYYKIKQLIIKPRMSISEQYHEHRTETWCITSGRGQAFINGRIEVLKKGDCFTVKQKDWHKVINLSDDEDLIAIEVQLGDICEEDDIVRKNGTR